MASRDASQIESRLEFAVHIARQAGLHTLTKFRAAGLEVQRKSDGSPVTDADREAEQLLRQLIQDRFPDDAILGEEFGDSAGNSRFRWVLDPIDGTKSFVSGVPLYATLVAVLHDDTPALGVIFAPAVDEMIYASTDQGCWHVVGKSKPQRAQVSRVSTLAEALFVTTSVKAFSTDRTLDCHTVFDQLQKSCRLTRTWGDAFGYLLVATGRAEVMIDPKLSLWDAAALAPVIEEAGGKFCDWQGRATVHSGEALATNAALAEEVLAILRARE